MHIIIIMHAYKNKITTVIGRNCRTHSASKIKKITVTKQLLKLVFVCVCLPFLLLLSPNLIVS